MYHKRFIRSYVIVATHRDMNTLSLLVGILMMTIVVTSITASLPDHVAYAHTFSQNENALFLTLVHQIEAQMLLTEKNFHTNPKLAEQHASIAISLLNQNDPVVNLTWTSQISERNPRIAAELTSVLDSLRNAATSQSKLNSTTTTSSDTANDIQTKVHRINGLLGEAVSSRVTKETLNNSTTQALVLANLLNEVYFSYGRALESPSTMSNMAGIAISVKEASPLNMSTNMITGNTGMSSSMTMTSNTVKNITEYHSAQLLAGMAKEIFNKNLKPISSSELKAANAEVENDLTQLKAAIDNRAPFMDIKKIVHIQLHPILITAYNLQLKIF
jgi:hypothetical protein